MKRELFVVRSKRVFACGSCAENFYHRFRIRIMLKYLVVVRE